VKERSDTAYLPKYLARKNEGGVELNDWKQIMIQVPDSLLQEVDGVIIMENLSRSQFVQDAMRLYVGELRRKALREMMRQGYQEMAALNLLLAEEGITADTEVYDLLPALAWQRD
jgi:CopG family transcriptional regulator/antitoxin EndoAI